MSNRFRPPYAPPPAVPPMTPQEILDQAIRVTRTVEDLCVGFPADANTVLAMAYLTHCRAMGVGREHIFHALEVLMQPEPLACPKGAPS